MRNIASGAGRSERLLMGFPLCGKSYRSVSVVVDALRGARVVAKTESESEVEPCEFLWPGEQLCGCERCAMQESGGPALRRVSGSGSDERVPCPVGHMPVGEGEWSRVRGWQVVKVAVVVVSIVIALAIVYRAGWASCDAVSAFPSWWSVRQGAQL